MIDHLRERLVVLVKLLLHELAAELDHLVMVHALVGEVSELSAARIQVSSAAAVSEHEPLLATFRRSVNNKTIYIL